MELEDQMDNAGLTVISTKCINGHKFQVPREKIQTSSSGKSFVTLCPKCNKVARLRKEEVYALFGVNPRDPVAIGGLFSTLSSQSHAPAPTTGIVVPKNGMTLQDAFGANGSGKISFPRDEEDEDGGDEEDEDGEEEEDEEIESDEDTEYTAQVETTGDISGRKKNVRRFRVVSDESDDEDDGEEELQKTPVKAKKQNAKKAVRTRVRNVVTQDDDDEDDEYEDEEDEKPVKRSRKPSPLLEEDEPSDPNDILKDVIEESGMDEPSVARIFDYIDLQPDGWQPAAIQGMLQMYISPAAAAKIAQRYQAALYIEQKKRERERNLMNFVGNPAGNMRLHEMGGTNIPPFNNPLTRGNPGMGVPMGNPMGNQMGGYQPPTGEPFYPQDPRFGGQPQYGQPQYQNMPFQQAPQRRAPSAFEVKQMIAEELESKFEKLQQTLTQSKREDALQDEIKQMRALVFDVLRQPKQDPGAQTPGKQTDPLMVSLLTNQAELNKTLISHAITKPQEDPMQKMLMQEIMNLKNSKSAPRLNTSEELTQRIQLQKLANEMELSQSEFKDKSEGRQFARDLASQALSRIGESVANAYMESQRIAAMQAQSQPVGLTPPPAAEMAPSGQVTVEKTQEPAQPVASKQTGEKDAHPPVLTETEVDKYHVRGTPMDDGSLALPCPVCGSSITAHPGDTSVVCNTCGTSFNAAAKPTQHEEPIPEQMVAQTTPDEEPPRTPKVIL